MKLSPVLLVGWCILAGLAHSVEARVVRLVVERITPYAGGRTFAEAGVFERLEGTVYMEVDSKDPRNAVIVNLDRASHNAAGLVEFDAPFVIIKPTDMTRGNGKLLYGINNRGNAIEIPFQTFPTLTPDAPADTGDGLIFRLGYAFVDAGWAGDITTTQARLGANLPVAVQADGSPIVADIRIEYSGEGYSFPLKGNERFRSYEAADTNPARSTLTVRRAADGPPAVIASDRWAFGTCEAGGVSLIPSTTDLCLFDGFDPDRIYELTYPAKNPWVMGLGYAVTRDLASFLRYERADSAGNPNPLTRPTGPGLKRVYGLGISSTGMYMRDFLYLGFNEDEMRRQVFDAVRIHIPGTHRLFANVEFADPNVYSRQDQHSDYTSHSLPPLTYAVTTDPISGIRDGILKRSATDPLVFHVDSSNEFWQMNASLNVHDGLGNRVALPDNVRLYSIASHSHVGATGVGAIPSARGTCAYATNGYRSYAPVMRALLVALDQWADGGIAPPRSDYPDILDGTLVSVEEAGRAFPAIPGVTFPTVVNGLSAFDYGPMFSSVGGRVTMLPPTRGSRYMVLVPTPDRDGHDLAGIRTVDIAVPVGTNTGWNLRAAGARGQDLCGLNGSFFPFFDTKAERLATSDPRPSLAERYGDHDGFVTAVRDASQRLVRRRLLLAEDASVIVGQAQASDILR